MNISEIGNTTLRIAIAKSKENENGLDYEEALWKAMYVYPKPKNQNIKTITGHADQIYLNELIETSICECWPEFFKPLTFRNVEKFFQGESKQGLMSGKKRTVRKNRNRWNAEEGEWEAYDEIKNITEYEYMFNDIFHISSGLILECKVYKDGKGRKRHIDDIRRDRGRFRSADYFILAHDKSDVEFDITDLMSMTQQGYDRYHDFRELVT